MNLIKLTAIFALILTLAVSVDARTTIHSLAIKTHQITENISISVYVPESGIQKTLPTLYLMDGQHYFYSSVGIQQSINHRNITIPSFIVVAIDTSELPEPSLLRHQLLNSRSEEMKSILLTQIVPLVDSSYPTSSMKVYFGWEHAAGFGIDLVNSSDFNGFLLASAPNLSKTRTSAIQQTLQGKHEIQKRLYMALGHREFHGIKEHKLLDDLAKKHQNANFKLEFNLTKEHGHFTTPLNLLTSGLMWIFSDFIEVNFYSIEDVIQFGGVNGVVNYYETRAKKYQVPNQIPENTKFTLARHAVESNNKELLDEVIERLGTFETGGEYWGYYFAQFAFDRNDKELAEQFIASSTSDSSPSYRLLTLQGDIMASTHRLKEAKHFYVQALMATTAEHNKKVIQDKIKALDIR